MKGQASFKKRVYPSKRKIFLYGSGTFIALFTLLASLYMYGVEIETSGDIVCGRTCESYFNITLSNYSLCFGSTFKGVYLEDATYELYKADMRYRSDNPLRWKPYELKSGVCLDPGKKYEFKLVGHKKTSANIKWGVMYDGFNADPYWIGSPDLENGTIQFIGNSSVIGCTGEIACAGLGSAACQACSQCAYTAYSCSAAPSDCTTHATQGPCENCGCTWTSAGTYNTTIFNDGFETDITTNWTAVGETILRTSAQKNSGTWSGTIGSATVTTTNDFIYTKAGLMDTSACVAIYVQYYFRDDDLDATDFELYLNDTNGVFDNNRSLNQVGEDAWYLTRFKITDSQYFHKGFAIGWGDDCSAGEQGWLDDVLIKCETASPPTCDGTEPTCSNQAAGACDECGCSETTESCSNDGSCAACATEADCDPDCVAAGCSLDIAYDTESDEDYVTYENALINGFGTILNVSVTINITSYNNTASSAKGNANPDIYLELANGSGTWYEVGGFGINGLGNFTLYSAEQGVLDWWMLSDDNIDIRVRGRGFDSGSWDEINYTDVWVWIDDPAAYLNYSLNSTNSTVAGSDVSHSLYWESSEGLDGYIFSFCNGTWNGTDCLPIVTTTIQLETAETEVLEDGVIDSYSPNFNVSNSITTPYIGRFTGTDLSYAPFTKDVNMNGTEIVYRKSMAGVNWIDNFTIVNINVTSCLTETQLSAVAYNGTSTSPQTLLKEGPAISCVANSLLVLTLGLEFPSPIPTNLWYGVKATNGNNVTFQINRSGTQINSIKQSGAWTLLDTGNKTFMRMTTETNTSFLIKFNTSSIPKGVVIENVILSIHNLYSINARCGFNVWSVADGWTEDNVSHNTRPAIISFLGDNTSQILASSRIHFINKTTTIGEINTSFIITPNSTSSCVFNPQIPTKEYAVASQRPYLNITYSTNAWVNDSFITMTETGNWSNVTKSVNTTVGANISWYVWANDTLNNINQSRVFSYATTSSAVDTCSCPASGNWAGLCSDNCVISSNCNMQGNNVTITGTGVWTLSANITNFNVVTLKGTSAADQCIVRCTAAGCFRK